MKRILVGITGASGVIYGVRLIEELRKQGVETHLIISDKAKKIFEVETNYKTKDIEKSVCRRKSLAFRRKMFLQETLLRNLITAMVMITIP